MKQLLDYCVLRSEKQHHTKISRTNATLPSQQGYGCCSYRGATDSATDSSTGLTVPILRCTNRSRPTNRPDDGHKRPDTNSRALSQAALFNLHKGMHLVSRAPGQSISGPMDLAYHYRMVTLPLVEHTVVLSYLPLVAGVLVFCL